MKNINSPTFCVLEREEVIVYCTEYSSLRPLNQLEKKEYN